MRVVKKWFKKILPGILFVNSIFLMVIGYIIGLFMTFTILSLFIFVIFLGLYKFESELRAFINPNFSYNKRKRRKRKRNLDRKVIKKVREKIKDQQEKQEKKRKALVFLTFYVKDMKKLGVIQIFTIVGLIITGLKFVVFHYTKSLYINIPGSDILIFWRNLIFGGDLNFQLNEDFFISSILVIYFAIVFYIYKTNFIFQCNLIKENNKNKSQKP